MGSVGCLETPAGGHWNLEPVVLTHCKAKPICFITASVECICNKQYGYCQVHTQYSCKIYIGMKVLELIQTHACHHMCIKKDILTSGTKTWVNVFGQMQCVAVPYLENGTPMHFTLETNAQCTTTCHKALLNFKKG